MRRLKPCPCGSGMPGSLRYLPHLKRLAIGCEQCRQPAVSMPRLARAAVARRRLEELKEEAELRRQLGAVFA